MANSTNGPLPIAAQMFTLRDYTKTPADIARACAQVRKIGYEAIQISAFGPAAPEEIARILKNEGLACCATHTPFERMQTQLQRVVEEHQMWNCQHAAIGSLPGHYRANRAYGQFVQDANAVAAKLAESGISFSYHNHAFELERFDGRTILAAILEDADAQTVNLEIDTYWIQFGGGDPAQWVRRAAGRVPLLHLKDFAMLNDKQLMAEVGEGNLNWPAILAAAQQAGVQWYIVEQDVCLRDPFESLEISLRNLRAMLA